MRKFCRAAFEGLISLAAFFSSFSTLRLYSNRTRRASKIGRVRHLFGTIRRVRPELNFCRTFCSPISKNLIYPTRFFSVQIGHFRGRKHSRHVPVFAGLFIGFAILATLDRKSSLTCKTLSGPRSRGPDEIPVVLKVPHALTDFGARWRSCYNGHRTKAKSRKSLTRGTRWYTSTRSPFISG